MQTISISLCGHLIRIKFHCLHYWKFFSYFILIIATCITASFSNIFVITAAKEIDKDQKKKKPGKALKQIQYLQKKNLLIINTDINY